MFHFRKKPRDLSASSQGKSHTVRNAVFIVVGLIVAVTVFMFFKAGIAVNQISTGNIFESIARSIPGTKSVLEGEKTDRINILILGMRGENVDGGGLLTDTIMVVSVAPNRNALSIISIPRDLYVTVPGTGDQQKINSVHFYGEEKDQGQGLKDVGAVVGEISGQTIHYAVSIDFKGFEELVDAIGGVDVFLNEPFIEPIQFHEERVCDTSVFTVPSGNFELKIDHRGKEVARYPLCYNSVEECGGVFSLPAGEQTLNGEMALCYARARATSSDFDRARRQQEIMKEIKDKMLSIGTLSDFGKLSDILNALGNNVRTDMEAWEIKRAWEISGGMQDPQITQFVLENSKEGLLYAPESDATRGYILLPLGDTYDRIHEKFRAILPEKNNEVRSTN